MTIRPELIDELLKECSDPREVLAEGGLIKQLTKAIIERCLETELDAHLSYPKHGRRGEGTTNARNGSSYKKLIHNWKPALNCFAIEFAERVPQ